MYIVFMLFKLVRCEIKKAERERVIERVASKVMGQ